MLKKDDNLEIVLHNYRSLKYIFEIINHNFYNKDTKILNFQVNNQITKQIIKQKNRNIR